MENQRDCFQKEAKIKLELSSCPFWKINAILLSTFPMHSHNEQIVGIISVFFICVSIVSFCLKTHPDMRVPAIKNITVKTANHGIAWTLDKTETNAHEFFFYIECICNGWFTFEILVSLIQSEHALLIKISTAVRRCFVCAVHRYLLC